MKKLTILTIYSLLIFAGTVSAQPDVLWGQNYPGVTAAEVIELADGGFALVTDAGLVRTDSNGDALWTRTYNAIGLACITQTTDGGYALAGATSINGYNQHNLIKTDADFNLEWNQPYDMINAQYDGFSDIVQTADGGYALFGTTYTGIYNQYLSGFDFYLVKTDANGNQEWAQIYDSSPGMEHAEDFGHAIVQTSDGGYAMAGQGKFAQTQCDFWLVQTDSEGAVIWDQRYGEAVGAFNQGATQICYDMIQTSDGGFALAGNYVGAFEGGNNFANSYLVKTDADGNLEWEHVYEVGHQSALFSITQTADQGYAMGGIEMFSQNENGMQWVLIKTDADGTSLWDQNYGGEGTDNLYSVIQTNDGGYALAGMTNQYGQQDKCWLVRLSPENNFDGYNDFVATDDSHSIVITTANFNNSPVPTGWEIGVFTQNGLLAGGDVWTDGQQLGIAVWGDDELTQGVVEGFVDGDVMSFRLWDNITNVEYSTVATVAQGSLNWAVDEATQLSLDGYQIYTLNIELANNWNLISINVVPSDMNLYQGDLGPEIIPMMAQFSDHLVLMKDEDGRFYWPGANFNNIPFWNVAEGYQVKMNQAMQGSWTGTLIPADTDVPIEQGWNFIAYFPTYQLGAGQNDFYVVSPILNNVIIAKNRGGDFMLPQNGFSNMAPWRETQGYQIKVTAPVVLNYPTNEPNTDAVNPTVDPTNAHWAAHEVTGLNMSVLVTSIDGLSVQAGDQVAAFGVNGTVVGVGTVQNDGKCGIAVWGDDASTEAIDGLQNGEAFSLRLWNADKNAEFDLEVNVSQGSLTYETDGLAAMTASVVVAAPANFYLSQSYPNPFNSTTRISFGLPEAAFVNVSVFDMNGRWVATLAEGEISAGSHAAVWNADAAPAGLYMVKMQAGSYSETRKLTLVK